MQLLLLPGVVSQSAARSAESSQNENANIFCRLNSVGECSGKQHKFVQRTLSANPFEGVRVPSRSRPVHYDFDSDGDFDLLVGGYERGLGCLVYLENIGTATLPKYIRLADAASPVGHIKLKGDGGFNVVVTPLLSDLDDDGDMDFILFGKKNWGTTTTALGQYGMRYFNNTGNRTHPFFREYNFTAVEQARLYDIDDDQMANKGGLVQQAFAFPLYGKQYFVANDLASNRFYLFENVGGNPAQFVERENENPLQKFVNPCEYATLTSLDMDNDGDDDVVVGCSISVLTYLENTGSPSNPTYTLRQGKSNPLSHITIAAPQIVPDAFDIDADGDVDIVVGTYNAGLQFIENTQSLDLEFNLFGEDDDANVFRDLSFDQMPTPCVVDFDGNAKTIEFIVGGESGFIDYIKARVGSRYIKYTTASLTNPLHGIHVGSFSAPGVWDVDGDYDQDVVIADGTGHLTFVENVGNATHPRFVVKVGALNPFEDIKLGEATQFSPSGADMDGDGDTDLIAGTVEQEGGGYRGYHSLRYWENVGNATHSSYVEKQRSENPFYHVYWANCCGRKSAKQALYDWDYDGDLDLTLTGGMGYFNYYENVGNSTHAKYGSRALVHPLHAFDVGSKMAFAIVDLDAKGDPDVVVGVEENGEHNLRVFLANNCEHSNSCGGRGICAQNNATGNLHCKCIEISASGTHCQNCPAGTSEKQFESGSTLKVPHAPSCRPCPSGSWSSSTGTVNATCFTCPTGTYRSTFAATTPTDCIACPAGFFSSSMFPSYCSPCVAGKYQGKAGSSSCNDCPLGWSMSNTGFSTCKKCQEGYYSSRTSSSRCDECRPGTYANKKGLDSCEECPSGFYRGNEDSDLTGCVQCPAGYANLKIGQPFW